MEEKDVLLAAERQQQQKILTGKRHVTAPLLNGIGSSCSSGSSTAASGDAELLPDAAAAAAASDVAAAAASVDAAASVVGPLPGPRVTKKMRQQPRGEEKMMQTNHTSLRRGAASPASAEAAAAAAAAILEECVEKTSAAAHVQQPRRSRLSSSVSPSAALLGKKRKSSSSSRSSSPSSSPSSSSSKGSACDVIGGRCSRNSSVLFLAVRSVGRVTDAIPFSVSYLGGKCFICCSVGKCFQVYEGEKLRVVFTSSPPLQQRIRLLLADRATVFVAEKRRILALRRLESLLSFSLPPAAAAVLPLVAKRCICRCRRLCSSSSTPGSADTSSSSRGREGEPRCEACEELQEEEKVKGMFVMGSWLVGFTSLQVCVWDKQTGELLRVISPAEALRRRQHALLLQQQQKQQQQCPAASVEDAHAAHPAHISSAPVAPLLLPTAAGAGAAALGGATSLQTAYPGLLLSAALHPDTYLRKALLGFENGVLLIVNLHTGTCVHELRCLCTPEGTSAGAPQLMLGSLRSSSSTDGSEADEEEEEEATGAAAASGSHPRSPAARSVAVEGEAAAAAAAAGRAQESSNMLWGGVTCMAASGEPDVVGVGFSTGRLAVVDIRRDDLLLQFRHSAAQGRVCALAFRRDAGAAAADLELREDHAGEEEEAAAAGAAAAGAAAGGAVGREVSATATAAAAAILVSGAHNGDLLIWNLETGAFHGLVPKAHDGPIVALQFLPGQPLLLSSGVDNSLVLWIFDQADGLPRELKARRGHVGDVDRMRFYDGEGTELLTSSTLRGRGHLGKTSFIQQQQNCEFSAKLLRKKAPEWGLPFKRLPPVVDYAFAPSRHFDWPNVVSIHQNCHTAFVWSYHDKTLAPLRLRVSRDATAAATAVAASACGNYVVIGYEDGLLHRFNLQSGAYRGAYTVPPPPQQGGGKQQQQQRDNLMAAGAAHVCGLAVLSSTVLLSACAHPQDAAVYTWDLLTRELQQRFELPSDRPHTRSSSNGNSSSSSSSGIQALCCCGTLTAVVMQSGVVFLVDVISQTTLRRIWLEGAPAAAVAFSPDTRWLAVAAAAGAPAGPSLFVYDVLSATVVDWMGFAAPVKALTFDPSGAFLLTSHDHAGGGICVWANKYTFDPTLAAPLLNRSCTAPIFVEEPPPDVQQREEDGEKEEEGMQQQQQQLQQRQPLHTQQKGHASEGKEQEAGATTKKSKTETQEQEHNKKQQQQLAKCVGPYYKTQRRQLFEGLLTLSSVAPAQLQALVCLEELRAKCKPKVPVAEKVPDAPFFLPTRADPQGTKFALPPVESPVSGQQQQQRQQQGQEAAEAARKRQAAAEAADQAVAFFLGTSTSQRGDSQLQKENSSSSGSHKGSKSTARARKGEKKKQLVDYRSPLQKLLAAAASLEAASSSAGAAAAGSNSCCTSNTQRQDEQDSNSSSSKGDVASSSSPLLSSSPAVRSSSSSKIYEAILVYLRSLSPSAAALALQDVGFYSGGTNQELVTLLRFFNYHVSRRHEADLVQALLHLFLQAHGDTLAAAAPLSEEARLCRRLHARMSRDWKNLESCFERLQCFLKFLTHLETL